MKKVYYCLVSSRPIIVAEEDVEEMRFDDLFVKAKKAYILEIQRVGNQIDIKLGLANNAYMRCDAIYALDEKDPLYTEVRSRLSGIQIIKNI
jgi:hypothetical protein